MMNRSLFLTLISTLTRDQQNSLNLVSHSFQDQMWGNLSKTLLFKFSRQKTMSTDSAGRIRACISGLSNPLWSPRMQPLHASMLERNNHQEFGTYCYGIVLFVGIRIDLKIDLGQGVSMVSKLEKNKQPFLHSITNVKHCKKKWCIESRVFHPPARVLPARVDRYESLANVSL